MNERTYRIELTPRAERDLLGLPSTIQRRLIPRIDALAHEPRPPGVRKLSGAEELYRVRSGDYRIIYEIRDRLLLILIVHVRHRREAYRR